jgi:hypothetical protein
MGRKLPAPLSPAHHDINLTAAAARTDQPFAPIRVLIAETVARCDRGRIAPATAACAIIRIICGSWSLIEGFNQPTCRNMRANEGPGGYVVEPARVERA